MPAAMTVAIAASVKSGRALRAANRDRAFSKFSIPPLPTLRAETSQIGQAVASQFIWVALTSLPFST